MENRKIHLLISDLVIIGISILFAIYLGKSGLIEKFLSSTKELEVVGSFVAGLFFTSIFTTAPAIVALGELGANNSVLLVAIFGALGAMIGDFIIFKFIRDRFSDHIIELLGLNSRKHRFKMLFKSGLMRKASFIVGGIIIASPLPDELGVSLIGFSKADTKLFAAISLSFNFIGIVIVGLIAKSLIQ